MAIIGKKEFFKGINDQFIKDQLKELTNKAFKKELFGAPTFITINNIINYIYMGIMRAINFNIRSRKIKWNYKFSNNH